MYRLVVVPTAVLAMLGCSGPGYDLPDVPKPSGAGVPTFQSGAAAAPPPAAQDRPRLDPPPRPPSASPHCDALIARANADPAQARVFGDIADYDVKKSSWMEFKTMADLKAASTGDNLNSIAQVWLANDAVALVRAGYSSPSGDWYEEVDNCFDSEGTLEVARAELRTFYGNVIFRRDLVRRSGGDFLETGRAFFDLYTGQPTTRPTDFGDWFDSKIPGIRNVRALPFYELITRKAK